MNTLSIARRLLLAFGVVVVVFLIVGATSLFSSLRLGEAESWNRHTVEVMGTGDRMLESMINMETGARGFLLSGEDAFLAPWVQGQTAFDKAWNEARTLTADNAEQQKRLEAMKAASAGFASVAAGMIQMRRDVGAGKVEMAQLMREFKAGKDKAAMDSFRGLQAEFVGAEEGLLKSRAEAADSLRSLNRWVIVFGSLAAIVIAVGMGVWVTRSITGQLGGEPLYAAGVVREIAAGNLAVDVQVSGGNPASLLAAMREMRDGLAQVVARVRQGAESVSMASGEIAVGNTDLSQRTEEQASALQQTAATMEQLGGTVRNNAENSRQAHQLAQGAAAIAEQGGDVVGQVVTTMQGISESSRRIGDIIGVIDGIAFQTNILALNAAVEAARAGEQGRGFAVVAGEVRTLAQRSAEAAKEIKSLIGRNVEQVEQGTGLVDRAGKTMGELVEAVRRVSGIMTEISAATNEQTNGIQQVGDAIGQMDQTTQQNAALVEQSAAGAESLKTQAIQLVESVAVFKLTGQAA
ncbi:methyl-accepting chemotaxis protein [Rubrivivax gelatinosus]|uniref:Methyl-accepting chemotaxis sensory transducer with Cache sensor n=1 Tax=Rubrivivax gelatinosus (strain NBRC 100245 / IL144) TaxID=983917 RepID=I0HM10_RUBGI|nr:methyl-accepting chemotaxis protein [Rubrivivax gelatinosus]BAL94047.1 methyl-accepting chemotaxis sensory transducer with Cache sensor [Rubrivivax gelatinosus IL144]